MSLLHHRNKFGELYLYLTCYLIHYLIQWWASEVILHFSKSFFFFFLWMKSLGPEVVFYEIHTSITKQWLKIEQEETGLDSWSDCMKTAVRMQILPCPVLQSHPGAQTKPASGTHTMPFFLSLAGKGYQMHLRIPNVLCPSHSVPEMHCLKISCPFSVVNLMYNNLVNIIVKK